MMQAMTEYDAYKMYLALKAHFQTEKYNVIEQRGRIKSSYKNFQGSGKSLLMAFYAGLLVREPAMANPTLVVLTDRTCKFDKTLPEAYYTDLNGDRSTLCYWFGVKQVHFESPTEELRSIPKKQFHLVKNMI